MPIISSSPSTPGIGAQIAGAPTICTFGGLPLPNNQGTLPAINLNDVASWYLQDISIDHHSRAIGIQPLIARARSVYVSDDFLNKTITLSLWYSEASFPLGQALARLSQAGEQQLSFDNVTYILAKYRGARTPKLIRKYSPYLWQVQIEFTCREPWFKDVNNTQTTAQNVVAAPTTAPSAVPLAGGSLATGTYTLAYTYVTASGETATSPATTLAPSFPTSDYRQGRITHRRTSRTSGSALATQMGALNSPTRELRSYATTRVIPQGSATVLSGANLQMSVAAVTLPTWATAIKWYIVSGPTTGFTVQNATGNAFTLNTAGNGVAAPVTSGGTAIFYVTYGGSVWAEPVFTLLIPSSNPNTVTTLVISNTMSGETLTVNFPGGLGSGRAWTITVDSSQWTVVDQTGTSTDYSGSFPMLYGPPGQVNPFVVQCVGSPANPSGLSLQVTYNSRWEL